MIANSGGEKHLNASGAKYVREKMPMIGLGTYEVRSAETIFDIVDEALSAGYRFIDTAQVYRNEQHIGEALEKLMPKYGLERGDIFITSKLAPANQGAQNCRQSVMESLERLKTDYLDLLLIHWPGTSKLGRSDPKNAQLRAESWREMEKMHNEGIIRAIGVSNFTVAHLEELFEYAQILPAVNQCEYHPHWYEPELVQFCRQHGIHFQAYSSFGSESNREQMFADPKVQAMAAKYGCSVPAFLLGWSLAQGMSVLPRSRNRAHVRANFVDTEALEISEEDVEAVKSDRMSKYCWDPNGIR